MTVFSSANALRFCLTLSLLLCLTPLTAHAQQTAPSVGASRIVPISDPAYTDVNTLQRAGIVIGYPNGTYSSRRIGTRAEFAVAVARLFPFILPNSDASPQKMGPNTSKMMWVLRTHSAAYYALVELVNEFAPELTAMGQNVPAVQAQLAQIHLISPPFSDVPKGHWAYQAVETLRKAGIVRGEGDGRFLSHSHSPS